MKDRPTYQLSLTVEDVKIINLVFGYEFFTHPEAPLQNAEWLGKSANITSFQGNKDNTPVINQTEQDQNQEKPVDGNSENEQKKEEWDTCFSDCKEIKP